ncbi:MAG: ABC transporter ATP-binding protein [bacterium]
MKLNIRNVSKKYKDKIWGIKDISLELEPGIIGLLGPNGAGKTTLMNILATITKPSEGVVMWNDDDVSIHPNMLRRDLGYLPQYFGIYPHLTAIEFLQYISALKGINGRNAKNKIYELLELVNLVDVCNRPLGGFSEGMKQRVGIAQSLLNDPKLLIVDEPTAGLDPEERIRFRNLLSDLSGNRIVILSTHIVTDIEATATDIAIISRGRLLQHTTPEKLLQMVEGKVWLCIITSDQVQQFREKYLISSTARKSDGVYIRVVSELPPSSNAYQTPPNLEDAYLYFISSSNSYI